MKTSGMRLRVPLQANAAPNGTGRLAAAVAEHDESNAAPVGVRLVCNVGAASKPLANEVTLAINLHGEPHILSFTRETARQTAWTLLAALGELSQAHPKTTVSSAPVSGADLTERVNNLATAAGWDLSTHSQLGLAATPQRRRTKHWGDAQRLARWGELKLNSYEIAAALGLKSPWVVSAVKKANRLAHQRGEEPLIFNGRYSSPERVSRWMDEHPNFIASHVLVGPDRVAEYRERKRERRRRELQRRKGGAS